MNIQNWLDKFIQYWRTYEVGGVLNLFTPDVEYWETPFQKVESNDKLKSEWEAIKTQKDIQIECCVFNQEGDKYSVIWDLHYSNFEGNRRHCKGTYLIRLNNHGLCDYFMQCCECKE